MNHNFTCETGWELLNEKGEVVDSSFSKNDSSIEGTFRVSVVDEDDNELKSSKEQPMRSFVSGFLTEALGGYRLDLGDKSFADYYGAARNQADASKRYTLIGSSSSPTYVQQIRPIKPPTIFSNSALMNNSNANSTISTFMLDEIDESNEGYIEIKFHTEKAIIGVSGTIREICLYGTNGRMIARDVLDSDFTYQSNDFIKIHWSLRFPRTKGYTLTKNWIQNFLQNLTKSYDYQNYQFEKFHYYDFINDQVLESNGVNNISGRTFTKFDNIIASNADNTMGIVIGNSNTNVTYDDSKMGNLIINGNGIDYGEMNTSSTWSEEYLVNVNSNTEILPMITPAEGKAYVRFWRTFTNSGVNDVEINEAGIFAKTSSTSEGVDTAGSYLISHWITGRIIIPPRYTLKIYWNPTVFATPESAPSTNDIVTIPENFRLHSVNTKTAARYRNISMIIANAVTIGGTSSSNKNWLQTNDLIDALNNANYGGYSDWRLPTCNGTITGTRPDVIEDETYIFAVDKANLHDLALNQNVSDNFTNPSTQYIWTESEYNTTYAYYINTASTTNPTYSRTSKTYTTNSYFRAVR